MRESLGQWIEGELRVAATAMQRSISPVELVKSRPGFGHSIRAVRGAIVASPVLASWDPEPDYFFHWYRDSAVVMDALRLLHEDGRVGPEALTQFADFVRFNASLATLDGSALLVAPAWRDKVAPNFLKYLRSEEDLADTRGDAVAADTRVNPDGTLDISSWTRPQHDGPPLRALCLLRWSQGCAFGRDLDAEVAALLRADLAFTFTHWQRPSFDIWEEEQGLHYYTLRVSAAALAEGADWLASRGDEPTALRYRVEAALIASRLDGFWMEEAGHYRSRVLSSGLRSSKELDIAVILAAVHAEGSGAAHTVHDLRMQATLARLEALFDGAYAINRNRDAQTGPAMGRYAGDVYFSGGAYYFSTLGAAEFCFRAAAGAQDARGWIERGDAWLATVRRFTPDSGGLSEQFDQNSGAQTSARHLAWSYAAFISCVAARRRALTGTLPP